ncbi:GtrA family protein [Agromyces protaetiae]|uniref:GtrA family protein n=1 Tax=Agromyces protaetiae TaxID=2509455 RepID=A0A4P6FVF6_9MICO|nr:GtrA family protein [Agromyces protaetiae]QAY74578.1 GtrA family protein [Agromyces protaetiae]
MIRKITDALFGENRQAVWRYIVSGVLSGLSMLATSFSCRALGVNDELSTVSGVLVSFVVSFALQKWWVFKSGSPVVIASMRFALVTTITWALSVGLYFVLVNLWGWPFAAVQVAVVCFVAGCNFTINRLWTFRDRTVSNDAA